MSVLSHTVTPCSMPEQSKGTLVLVHGLTSAGPTFTNVLEPLSRYATIVNVDLRGHGKSFEPEDVADFKLESMAADIKALLEHLSITEPVHILGHSWGSRVVLTFALMNPGSVKSLIVEDEFIDKDKPSEDPDNDDEKKIIEKAKAQKDEYKPTFPTFEEAFAFLEKQHGKDRVDYSRKIIKNDAGEFIPLFKPHVATVWDFYCRVADMNAVWKDVKAFPFKILIMKAGDKTSDIDDGMYKKLQMEAAAYGPDQRQLVLIPESSHPIHRTHPDDFVREMVSFLSQK